MRLLSIYPRGTPEPKIERSEAGVLDLYRSRIGGGLCLLASLEHPPVAYREG